MKIKYYTRGNDGLLDQNAHLFYSLDHNLLTWILCQNNLYSKIDIKDNFYHLAKFICESDKITIENQIELPDEQFKFLTLEQLDHILHKLVIGPMEKSIRERMNSLYFRQTELENTFKLNCDNLHYVVYDQESHIKEYKKNNIQMEKLSTHQICYIDQQRDNSNNIINCEKIDILPDTSPVSIESILNYLRNP